MTLDYSINIWKWKLTGMALAGIKIKNVMWNWN